MFCKKMAESDNQQEELWDESKGARSRVGVRREIGERSSLTLQHPAFRQAIVFNKCATVHVDHLLHQDGVRVGVPKDILCLNLVVRPNSGTVPRIKRPKPVL